MTLMSGRSRFRSSPRFRLSPRPRPALLSRWAATGSLLAALLLTAGMLPGPPGRVDPATAVAGHSAARHPPDLTGFGLEPARRGLEPTGRFRWPLDGTPRPVRRFDPPPRPWQPGHRGVDLAAGPGAVVRAAGPGTVAFAGPVAGRPVISVLHPGGLRTTYEPVRPGVSLGDRVAIGAPLGTLLAGHADCPAGACLHWGLRKGADYLDPLALLGLGRVRLLPLAAAQDARASSAGSPSASRSYSSGRL